MIASHYADPLVRHLVAGANLLPEPDNDAAPLAELRPGDEIRMLDLSRGWAWGYGQKVRASDLRYSTGAELRIFLPVFQFPIRFIYGIDPKKKPTDRFQSFTFTIGNTY